MPADSAVGIALLHPELLGTYGDGGNALVLAQRLRWRGVDAEVLPVHAGEPVPSSCELYVLGGGEDAPQALAAAELGDGTLARAVDRGAVVFAVCAGFQILGHEFLIAEGPRPGLGLLDCTTVRRAPRRAVGELVVEPDARLGLTTLTGYENHAGLTELGPDVRPLGRVMAGAGNAGDGREGAVEGRVVGTYLHGPALARNPALADLLLSWVMGRELAPVDDGDVERLRHERLAAALGRRARLRGWRRRVAIPVTR